MKMKSIARSVLVMPEPRDDDDIALGLDEETVEDESYDTLEEKYAD